MAKYKVVQKFSAMGTTYPVGLIVESEPNKVESPLYKIGEEILPTVKNGYGMLGESVKNLGRSLQKVDDSSKVTPMATPPKSNNTITDKQADQAIGFLNALPAALKRIQVLSTIGMLSGLGFAYHKKSGVGGYFGWGILGSLAGVFLAIASVKFIKPKETLSGDIKKELDKQMGAPGVGATKLGTEQRKTKIAQLAANAKKADPTLSDADYKTQLDVVNKMSDKDVNAMWASMKAGADPAAATSLTDAQQDALLRKYGSSKADVTAFGNRMMATMEAAMTTALGGGGLPTDKTTNASGNDNWGA